MLKNYWRSLIYFLSECQSRPSHPNIASVRERERERERYTRPCIALTFIWQQLEPLLSHAEKACKGMPEVQKKGSLEDLHASGADRRLLFISASLSIRCCHLWRRRRTLERTSYRALMCGLKWPEQNSVQRLYSHIQLSMIRQWCVVYHTTNKYN